MNIMLNIWFLQATSVHVWLLIFLCRMWQTHLLKQTREAEQLVYFGCRYFWLVNVFWIFYLHYKKNNSVVKMCLLKQITLWRMTDLYTQVLTTKKYFQCCVQSLQYWQIHVPTNYHENRTWRMKMDNEWSWIIVYSITGSAAKYPKGNKHNPRHAVIYLLFSMLLKNSFAFPCPLTHARSS